MHAAMRDPDIDADENTVLVLRNAGPVGAPGMPEWGNLPIPQKLLKKGVRDMVRLSDARMSGTHYGVLRAPRLAGSRDRRTLGARAGPAIRSSSMSRRASFTST